MAHVAEELEVRCLVAAALRHGPHMVHLEEGVCALTAEDLALAVELIAAVVALVVLLGPEDGHGLLGHTGAAVVCVLVHEALHEARELLAVVREAEACAVLEGLGECLEPVGLLGDLKDVDGHLLGLTLRAPPDAGLG